MKLLIKNTDVWGFNKILKNQDVVVINGIIEDILPTNNSPYPNFEIYAPKDALLHPLGVDVQAHLRVPGQKEKETAETGIKAALRGGYGAVLTMPNTSPVIDSPEICNLAMAEIKPWADQYGVDVYLSAAMTLGQLGRTPVKAQELASWGVKALTDDGKGVASDSVMEEMFKISEQTGLPLLQHAEMPGHGGVLAPGVVQKKLRVAPYFSAAETDMVKRDLLLLKKYPKAKYHVLHISSGQTVELVHQAKKEGLSVTCEVCPHHLLFTTDDILEENSSFKMNPPLRSRSDRDALRQGLAEGVIDFISTDHAPHEPAKKTKDFTAAAFGTTGLETALRALLYLHAKGELSARRVVESFSTAPAGFIGLNSVPFLIEKGQKFQCVVIEDKSKEFAIDKTDLASLSHNNCFVGFPMPGKITRVYNKAGVFQLS